MLLSDPGIIRRVKPLFVSNSLHKKWLNPIDNPSLIRYIIDIETTNYNKGV